MKARDYWGLDNLSVVLGSILLAALAGAFHLARWGLRLERRMECLEVGIDALEGRMGALEMRMEALERRIGSFIAALADAFSALDRQLALIMAVLTRHLPLSDTERIELTKAQVEFHRATPEALLTGQRSPGNPLSNEEMERLRGYVARARAGGTFTIEEVRDYNDLVEELRRENPLHPGIWPLISLGAFLLGLYIGTTPQEKGA